MKSKKIQIAHLLRPHWKALTIAFIAVIGESFTDLLEPWPLKVVFDYVLGSKQMPGWMSGFVNSTLGHDKLASGVANTALTRAAQFHDEPLTRHESVIGVETWVSPRGHRCLATDWRSNSTSSWLSFRALL